MEFDSSFFDAGLERRHTDCEKWDGMVDEHHDPEMIPMWVADMDFRSAPAIADAVKRVAEQGTWGYTLSGERDARALCDYWKRRHGVGFEPKDVQMGPCVVSELRLCVRALTEPGDGVLIFTPVYGPFYASITESGRRVVGRRDAPRRARPLHAEPRRRGGQAGRPRSQDGHVLLAA